MRKTLSRVFVVTSLFLFSIASNAMSFPVNNNWKIKTPAEMGMDGSKVNSFLSKIGSSTDALIIKDGVIVATKGDPHRNGNWASTRKLWLSLIATMMWNNREITSLDSTIGFPGLIGKDVDITWRSLMNMQSGYASTDQVNEKFAYNDRAISLFTAELQRVKGLNLTQALNNFLPELHFQSQDIIRADGTSNANLYDLAKLNLLLMNKGCWEGKPLIRRSVFNNVFANIATKPMSTSPDDEGGYLDIIYSGSSSNQTVHSGAGPNEYVFNGWINTKLKNGMPEDFFHGNGNWGRTIAGHSPSLGLVVVVRIKNGIPVAEKNVTNGPIMKNIYLLREAVDEKGLNRTNKNGCNINISPILPLLLG